MKTQIKIISIITCIWMSIAILSLLIVLKLDLGNIVSGIILISVNTLCYAFVLFKSEAIKNYFNKNVK